MVPPVPVSVPVVVCHDALWPDPGAQPPYAIAELLRVTGQAYTPPPADDAVAAVVAARTIPWTIDNRYYTATLHLALARHDAWSAELGASSDAAVFLIHKGEPESVATLRSLAPFGEPAVGLVVATSVGPAAVLDEATRMSLIEFCIEHGLELIDLDETTDDDDQEDGGLGVELFGAARIAEALASHRWPHMVMKPRLHGGVDADGEVEDEDEDERPPAVPEAASQSADAETEFTAFESAYTRMGDDEDEAIEGFERMLELVQGFRDVLAGAGGTARARNLGDDERRTMAAQVAMTLFQQFGLDDEEDEEEAGNATLPDTGDPTGR